MGVISGDLLRAGDCGHGRGAAGQGAFVGIQTYVAVQDTPRRAEHSAAAPQSHSTVGAGAAPPQLTPQPPASGRPDEDLISYNLE